MFTRTPIVSGAGSHDFVIEDGEPAIYVFRTAGTYRAVYLFNKVERCGQVDIICRRKVASLNNWNGPIARYTDNGSVWNAYCSTPGGSLTNIRIRSAVATTGSGTSIATVTGQENASAFVWERLRLTGTQIEAKRWAGELVDEPIAWGLLTTSADHVEGSVGFGIESGGIADEYFTHFFVGTNGDPAPRARVVNPAIWLRSFEAGVFAAQVAGGISVQPTGIASAEAFGTASVAFHASVAPTGIASAEAFGSASVSFNATIQPTGIASAEAFGSATATWTTEVAPAGIASTEAFGTTTVSPTFEGVVAPVGIASAEAFGTASVTWNATIEPAGIASAEAFGAASVDNVASITTTGIPSAEAFGTAGITWNATVAPAAIASEEAFGNAALSFNTEIAPAGVGSAEAFGVAEVVRHSVQSITVGGIASGEAFGSAALTWRTEVEPAGIASAEAFGTANLSGEITISPSGIASAEAFGNTTVDGAGTRSLTEQDLIDIANAVWAHPKALTLARFLGLK